MEEIDKIYKKLNKAFVLQVAVYALLPSVTFPAVQ